MLTMTHSSKPLEMKEQSNHKLHFKFIVQNPNSSFFSLKLEDSDFSSNQLILNSLVGTLVKYDLSGKISPYLAESWSVSDDRMKWIFRLKNNLSYSDNISIDALLFKSVLESNISKMLKTSDAVIVFDKLNGWHEFVNGESSGISGIKVNSTNEIEFDFLTYPGDVIEALRMPAFGLWIENNGVLQSTGSYELELYSKSKVIIKAKKNVQCEFKLIEFNFTNNFDPASESAEIVIYKVPYYQQYADYPRFFSVLSAPTRFEGFVLSPYKINLFNDIKNRKIFQNVVNSFWPEIVKSKNLFATARTDLLEDSDLKSHVLTSETKLTFAFERALYSDQELDDYKKIINSFLKGSNIEFEFVFKDNNNSGDFFKKTDSNSYFDARITTVDVGDWPDQFVLNMMFCTKLGVNFPDPNNSICSFLKNIKNDNFDQLAVDRLNKIIFDEAIIIPIKHHSEKWLVSNKIDPNTFPATTVYPRFDLIKLKYK